MAAVAVCRFVVVIESGAFAFGSCSQIVLHIPNASACVSVLCVYFIKFMYKLDNVLLAFMLQAATAAVKEP